MCSSMAPKFSSDVKEIMDDASHRASKVGCHEYTTLNLGYSLMRNPCGLLRRTICSLVDNSAGDRALSLFKARTAGTSVSNPDWACSTIKLCQGLLEDLEFRKVLQESNVPEQILKAKLQSLFNSALCRYGIDVLTESGMVNHLPLRDQELQLIMPRQDVACIGVATKGVYAKLLEKDIGGYFQTVEVPELEDISTLTILGSRKHEFEGHHCVRVLDSALEAAVNLSKKYIKGKYLPGKAITLIDAACGKVELEEEYYSLSCENVETTKSRLVEIGKELYALREELKPLTKNYKETEEMKETLRMMWRERAKLMEEISEHGDDVPVYKLYDLDKVLVTIKKSEVLATVGPDEVADVVSQWSGLPLSILAGNEKEKLNGLAERLQARVIGQDQAVDEVARAIRRSRYDFGLSKVSKLSYGSFLFLGPTGVGKTELAKALASELFGDERLITRINMSEYKNSASVTKLIGAAPGYVGYDEGGRLTNAVKKRPHGVILFDEAEKADQGIFDIFSQVLSDGRLTDSLGCTVDFTSTIIIFTSNIGAECLFESLSREEAESKVLQQVKRYFTSGFLSRLDGKVVFHPPNKAHIRQIVDLLAQDAVHRVSELGINLQFDKQALNLIAIEGYNEKMGARTLDRYMDSEVVDRLVDYVLYNNLGEKSSIYVSVEGGSLKFAVKRKREGGEDEYYQLPDKKHKNQM
ncbi:chaperone protein ClpB1 [Tanacetum coccineum]